MKRIVVIVLLGLAGIVAATSLTLGALAVAGDEVGSVVRPRLDEGRKGPSVAPSATSTRSPDPDRGNAGGSPSEASSTSSDDGGGSSTPEPGEDGGSDSSGSGSDGSGSDDSGSEDSDSGGSEDHSDDDD